MPNKIEQELSAEELEGFVKELAALPGLTLAKIQAAARTRGINVSLMSASAFRDKNLAEYLHRLRGASESAQLIAEAISGNAEGNILDGAALMLSQRINDLLVPGGVADLTEIRQAVAAVAQLRQSNQSEKLALARLREYEAKEELRKRAAEELERKKQALVQKGGLSEEALELMEAHAKLLG